MEDRESPPRTHKKRVPDPQSEVASAPPARAEAERVSPLPSPPDAPVSPVDPVRMVALRDRVAAVLCGSPGLAEASGPLLELLGNALGALSAELWMVDGDEKSLKAVQTWMSPSARGLKTHLFSRRSRLGLGEGFPGKVWESGEASWMPDIFEDAESRPTRNPASDSCAAWGFALRRGTSSHHPAVGPVRGVFRFVGRGWSPPSPDIRALMDFVGHHLAAHSEALNACASLCFSEEKFVRLAENSRDAIFRYRVKPPRGFDYVNAAFTQMTGYSADEARRQADLLDRLVHADDARLMDLGEMEIGERRDWFHVRWVARDGHVVPTEQTLSLVPGDVGKPLLEGIVRDLSASHALHEGMQDQFRRAEVLNALALATARHRDVGALCHAIACLLEEMLPVESANIKLLGADGETLEVVARGPRSRMLATSLGNGDRREVALNREGLERCVRGLDVLVADTRTKSSPTHARMASLGILSTLAVPLRVGSRLTGVLGLTSQSADGFSAGDRAFYGPMSEHVALAIDRLRSQAAMEMAYEALRASQEQALERERLQAMADLAASLCAHLDNSLSAVSVLASVGLRSKGLSQDLQHCLGRIMGASNEVSATFATLRQFYRRRDPSEAVSPMDLNLLLDDLIQQGAQGARGGSLDRSSEIGFRTMLEAQQAVLGNPAEMRDVFSELIRNARQAAPPGSEILVCTWDEPGAVAVSVRDEGPGLEESVRRRMVEPYFTTGAPDRTGLGLSICWGVLGRHNARLSVESEKGQGATFIVRIPVGGGAETVVTAGQRRGGLPRLNILVCEDEAMVRDQIQEMLREMGHGVMTTGNGWDAVQKLAESVFDVVLTDLRMPLMGGLEVAREVKRSSPRTPVILLATLAESSAMAAPEHIDLVTCKPATARSLEEALHLVLVAAGTGAVSRRP